MCDLKVRDLEFMENGRCRVTLHGKGQKTRRITITVDVARALLKYMKYRQILNIPDAYVFNTQRNPQLSIDCLEQIFERYVAKAKKENPTLFREDSYSPHSMRHTTAISMLEAGVPLAVIKVFLGHSSIATTEIYAKITQPTLEEAIESWNRTFWAHATEEACTNDEQDAGQETEEDDDHIPGFLR